MPTAERGADVIREISQPRLGWLVPRLLLAAALVVSATSTAPLAQAQGWPFRRGPKPVASGPSAVADSLIVQARRTAAAGDTAGAVRMLERATKAAPRYPAAFYEYGLLLASRTRFGVSDFFERRAAWAQFERAHNLDPGNPYYLLELARIRLKTPLLRLDAERLLRRALAAATKRRDSRALADVEWELGQMFDRRYFTGAQRRMITGAASSFNVVEALANPNYVPDFLDNQTQPIPDAGEIDLRQAESAYRSALTAVPGHIGSGTSLAVLLEETGRFAEMASQAAALTRAAPNEPGAWFALGLALFRVEKLTGADSAFSRALALLSSAERDRIAGTALLMRDSASTVHAKRSPAERAAFDSLFWSAADPLRLTPANEARLEFLSRVAYADLRFTSPEFDRRGWETDRGSIVLRYGRPPVVALLAAETAEVEGSEGMGRVTTVWLYPQLGLRFVFVGPPAMNTAFFAGEFRRYAENARDVIPASFENVTRRVVADSVAVQVSRFRGAPGAGTQVIIQAAVPARRLAAGADVDRLPLRTAVFIGAPGDERRMVRSDTVIVRRSDRESERMLSWTGRLGDGEHGYRVEAQDAITGRAARGRGSVTVGSVASTGFGVSDLLLARRIDPRDPNGTPRGVSDFSIAANPSLRYAAGDTAHVYWEIYAAQPDSAGTSRVSIDLRLTVEAVDRPPRDIVARVVGGAADAMRLSAKGQTRGALRYERAEALGTADRMVNYVALGLADAPYGTYVLEIVVTDLVSGRRANTTRRFTIPRP